MKFKYTARTKEGELQTGFVEAVNQETAGNILGGHNLFILSIEGSETKHWLDGLLRFFNLVRLVDLMVFTRQFATLLEASVPLGDAIKNLFRQTHNQILKEAVHEISSDVAAGLSLSQAMDRQPVFNEFYVNMIRSAEITGRLDSALNFLADYLEKEVSWQSKIKSALIYPLFVISLFVIVAIFLLVFVFPKLIPVFAESNVQLPIITKIFLSAGTFVIAWWWIIIIMVVLGAILITDYLKSKEGKNVANEIIVKIPVFGELFKKIYVARFAESLSVLISGGIPATQAIEITSHNIGNIIYRDILHEIAEKVRAGEMLSSLLSQNEYYFPALVGQMVAVGEATGRLNQMLSKISVFYSREVNNTLDNLSELIQPILISIVGIFVGLLFAAVLLPIFNLAQGFKTM